ncbi:DUF1493 family protein [Pedobacter faecalis]|uniref:DUF1493 family protein n=1 Tax=Pedobacter faecalis TaxID=3041495 RepID=UPI00254A76DE|nr:DUF1493 family protein [Pedobacter sp. ELA7]
MDNEIFNQLKSLIIEMRGRYKIELTRDTQLERDLKITGDDALEFFEEFGKRFDIDTEDLELSEYFAPEGSFSLYKLIFTGKETKKKVITLGHLEKAIALGKLDESILAD